MLRTVESSDETKQAQKNGINTDQIFMPACTAQRPADTVF
ncbi:hypothetical protein PCL1606_32650 [Pseudomonas chlororaphis]|uniref:Uncharacterized protein n=1 Tax=Pseudomonas chlororaphis TaxID=587753 RepID=A0A0D5Y098_9PSED|nr:hypothetical protein PCL1606_32650 [Pseudomonas chlororaphis]